MTEPNSYNSIDALFKKAFDGLPETPSSEGWDTPSGKVWEHVQTRIEAPRNGWSAQTLGLIAAFAVVLSIALYLVLFSYKSTPTPVVADPNTPGMVETPTQQETAPAVINSPVTAPVESKMPNTATKNRGVQSKAPTNTINTATPKLDNQPEQSAIGRRIAPRPGAALPLPGSKPASPNTTVARKQQSWQTPLPYLPMQRNKPQVPNIPASLRLQKQ